MIKRFATLAFLFSVFVFARAQRAYIDLGGQWLFTLDRDSILGPTDAFADVATLPGTTDTNRKGDALTKPDETTHLSRHFSYFGKAWYRRTVDIPKDWKRREIFLTLERTKPTRVFVDGTEAGRSSDISTAQRFRLTPFLSPGRHEIAIMVDNGYSVPKQLLSSSHAYTEDTQTNWNGIIGRITLEAADRTHISGMTVTPDAGKKSVTVNLQFSHALTGKDRIVITATPRNFQGKAFSVELNNGVKGKNALSATIGMDDRARLWSEFHPNLYTLSAEIKGKDRVEKVFGLRSFETRDYHFYINNNITFLRGKHDACVFPLTAHVPMDSASWRRYFTILKDYGINHVRFHSWCPPEECFNIADEMGFYLQPELPFWGDFNANDPYLMSFLHKEGENILRSYGHHPSFVMFALGNELWGDIPTMQRFIRDYHAQDSTKLYTLGSNYYLGYKETTDEMDFFVTCRVGGEAYGQYNTHVRGSFSFADAADGGQINHERPNTVMTFDEAIKKSPVPVISHETGQFQVYPDYDEMKKYTSVLRPCNMEVFRDRLQRAGMGDQAKAFRRASGLWAVELYKADMEMDLRSRLMAGYQLLDLQDYPGQGSAYVGVLDAFMDSKNLVSPQRWRQWCSPVVPLLELPQMCYTDGDTIMARMKVADYSEADGRNVSMKWAISAADGTVRAEGTSLINANKDKGLTDAGTLNTVARLASPTKSERLNITISISGTPYTNTYPVWVYPATDYGNSLSELSKGIVVADTLTDEIVEKLGKGAKVLLMPTDSAYAGHTVGGLLQTDYWNYRMFKTICVNNKKPVSPGTLGILTDPEHPLFTNFPTEEHTNWQWAPIVKQARPFILDLTPSAYRPVIQVIDNVERNHKLGIVFEMKVGRGSLLVCMADMSRISQYPEARRFHLSLLEYMQSDSFSPSADISVANLKRLFTEKVKEGEITELRNISFE